MNQPIDIAGKVSTFIRSLTADRELAAYMAGVLRGLYITGMQQEDAMTFLREAWLNGTPLDTEKLPQADAALRATLGVDVLAAVRLFDQASIN